MNNYIFETLKNLETELFDYVNWYNIFFFRLQKNLNIEKSV